MNKNVLVLKKMPNEAEFKLENCKLDDLFDENVKNYLVRISVFENWEELKEGFEKYNKTENYSLEEVKANFLERVRNKVHLEVNFEITNASERINSFQVGRLNILIVPNFLFRIISKADALHYRNFFGTKDYIVIPEKSLKNKRISIKQFLEHEMLHSLQNFLERIKILSLPEPPITREEIIEKMISKTNDIIDFRKNPDMIEEPFSWRDVGSFIKEFEAYFLHLEINSETFKTKKTGFEEGSLYDLGRLLNKNITKLYEDDEIPKTTKMILLNLTKNFYQLVPKITNENKFHIMLRIRGCKNFREILILFEEINQVKFNKNKLL